MMGSMAEEVRVRWCVVLMVDGCDGGRKDPKIPIESSVRRGCHGSSHFFFVKWYVMYIRCGSLVSTS